VGCLAACVSMQDSYGTKRACKLSKLILAWLIVSLAFNSNRIETIILMASWLCLDGLCDRSVPSRIIRTLITHNTEGEVHL